MEGSVKERLTGALIFVAALVIIVPEMFSGPEPGSAPAVPVVETADASPPLRTYSMTLDAAEEARVAAPVQLVPESTFPESPAMERSAAVAAPSAPAPSAPAPPTVAITKPPAVSKAATTADGDNNVWLQVGLFGVRDNAMRLEKSLRAAGFAVVIDKQLVRGKDMYRVRAGPVRDRTEALALQARLKAAGQASNLPPP